MPHAFEEQVNQLIQSCEYEDWTEAAQKLYKLWSDHCPLLYGTDKTEPWEYDFDEQTMHERLLAPLAAMYMLEPVKLANADDRVSLKPLTVKMGMTETDRRPGQICGKMFKSGDPTYTCKECALDDTCVLCHDCFDHSAHAKHKYKMHTSYGGGYCDCNDPEAWTKDFACTLHSNEQDLDDNEPVLMATVPDAIKRRIHNVTAILMKYTVTLVCWQDNVLLPPFLTECKLPDDWPQYKTILFNDETHTYDAVITALEVATSCNSQHAMYLATIVDREGRSVVFSSSETICKRVKESIQHKTRRDVNRRTERTGPLEVKIMTHGLVAHQTFAVKVLQWITTQAQQFPAIATIVADVLMDECAAGCKLGIDLYVPIPPPKPPRTLTHDNRPKPEPREIHQPLIIPEDAPLMIRAPNMEDADIVINPLRLLDQNFIRQRHESTNQNPQIPPPKLERHHIKPANNALPCGDLSTAVQLSLFDRRLWKAARTGFHHLLMSTILMDNRHKANFGAFLIRNYEFIYQDYIDDDHEYDVSIVAVNVQIFTVSSVAQRLIANENALAIIFETLRMHCHQYVRPLEHNDRFFRFDFSTGTSLPAILRRSLVMFKDAIYLLQASPVFWNAASTQSFIDAFETYTNFLVNLQDMDSVKRHADQHQLMDGEWETAFNIQVTMQEATTLFLNWAKTDPYVHQRCMKILLDQMYTISMCMPEYRVEETCQIDEFSTDVVTFAVSRGYISIHQPVWRMAAGMFMAPPDILKYYDFGNKEDKPGVIKIDQTLDELNQKGWGHRQPIDKLYIWPLFMMLENPLRVITLNSQCHAQLWRRNGFSLLNQIHNYTAPLCRMEMFNRDLQMLQVVAANMDPNEFLIRFLEKFTLDKWASKIFDELPLTSSTDSTPSTPASTPEELSKIVVVLSEEFLHLLIAIIGERYFPGVGKCTKEEAIQRDIIHLLCTGTKNFSTIEKNIVLESTTKSIKREEALNVVAEFQRPNKVAAGVFKLKEAYRTLYNPFYIHYSKQQLSQSEQTQWKERDKLSRDLQACPPPAPIEFEPFFEPILRIFESPLFIRILVLSLQRINKRSRYSSEGLLHRCLFLIGMGLNEQIEMTKKQKKFTFVQKMDEAKIYELLKGLEGKKETEPHHHLLWWVLRQYDHIKNTETVAVSTEMEVQEEVSAADKAAKRSQFAQKKREQALRMMQAMQKRFIKHSKEISGLEDVSNKLESADDGDDEFATLADSEGFPVCIGPKKSKVTINAARTETCILCQEEVQLTFDGPVMVCCAFVQNSKLFTQDGPTVTRNFQDPMEIFTPAHLAVGYSVSTCSHVMHADCFKTFSENLWNRDRSRPRLQVFQQQIIDQTKHEFLCPLCKRLSNAALPILPALDTLTQVYKASESRPMPAENFETWLINLLEASMKLNKLGDKEGRAGIKTHNRKRSHSERSLNEIQKREEQGSFSSIYSGSLAGPLSPASDSGLMEASTSAQPLHEQRGTSEPLDMTPRQMSPELERDIVAAAEKTADNSIHDIFFSNFNKLKSIIITGKKDNIPNSLANFTPVIKNFLSYLSEVGPDVNSLFPKEQFDVFRLYKSMAFVLRSTTAILKAEGKPLFGALNTRQRDIITCMTRLAAVNVLQLRTTVIQESVARALTPLLISWKDQKKDLFSNLSHSVPDFMSNILASTPLRNVFHLEGNETKTRGWATDPPTTPTSATTKSNKWHVHHEMSILDCDMLSLAVQLCMTIEYAVDGEPSKQQDSPLYRIPDGSVDELYVIYLTLLGHVFQTMASSPIPDENDADVMEDEDASTESKATIAQKKRLFQLLQSCILIHPDYERINLNKLLAAVKQSISSFLQPLALFYHAITLIPPPDVLKHSEYDSFEALCRYMGLPVHLEELLGGDYVTHLFFRWANHLIPVKDEIGKLVSQPIVPRELIALPDDFTDLIRKSTTYRCPSMKGSDHHGTTQTTMCLVCGALMCSQAYCCQKTFDKESVGACNYHMRMCSGESNGMFLRIRECQIVLLARKRGAYKPAPYVDQFGETDTGFRRGNPLKLHPEIYKKMQRLWLYQEVAEEVVNQYDMNHRNMNLEWHHF